MMIKFWYCTLVSLFLATGFLMAQNTYSISGKIIDSESGEPLVDASIIITGTTSGVLSNQNGFYSLVLKPGKYILLISFVGYNTISDSLSLFSDINRNYSLFIKSTETKEVIITARNLATNVQSTSTSIVNLTAKEIKELPSLMGESDVMRIIQLSPGVQSANEGNSGFNVRGGGADQNLVLLDNTVVYNPTHILGFFSVFNGDIIKDVKLIKSGMSANYGSRMSSVVEVNTIDPCDDKYSVYGTIGLISSKLMVNGPIVKNKISFYVAGRRSYLDEVLKPIIRPFIKGGSSFYNYSNYYFYDMNIKFLYRINNKSRLSLTYYNGNDYYSLNQYGLNYENQMNWGNTVLTSTFNRIINENSYIESTLSYTNYKFNLLAEQYNINIGFVSIVEDITFKLKVNKIKQNRRVIFGVDYQLHHFVPNKLDATVNDLQLNFGPNESIYSHEPTLFYNHEFDITNRIAVSAGLRYTIYLQTGPYSEYNKNNIGEIIDTTYFKWNNLIKNYNKLEPRITLKYQLSLNSSIKAAYTRHYQFIHMVSASSVTLPTDVWLPSTKTIKPQESDHYSIGYYRNSDNNEYTTSIEAYYKDLRNQVELLYGFINNMQDKTFEESMVFGKGKSYGLEFFIRKNTGKANGWISYTLSRTEKQFDEIYEGKVYPAKYDRRHDLNIVITYELSKKITLSGTFVYATGNAMTIPDYKMLISGNVITGSSKPNSFRMPAYHRLDLSVNFLLKKSKKYESALNLSIFNVYNRANPFFIYFEITGNIEEYNLKITPKQVTLFPIMPSLSWSFNF
jgi:hypothetical protein